jgi:hypothetical protein
MVDEYKREEVKGAHYFSEAERLSHFVLANKCKLEFADGEKLRGNLIFVMSEEGDIFASPVGDLPDRRTMRGSKAAPGGIYHSSFLAGSPVAAAGNLYVDDGRLTACDNGSGHYWPRKELNLQLLARLRELGCSDNQIPKECTEW